MGNPRLRTTKPAPAETRFKHWWHLCGAAIEFAAQQHASHVEAFVMECNPACSPTRERFKDLFLAQEEDEEESASLADALTALADQWPSGEPAPTIFLAADVATFINPKGEGTYTSDTAKGRIAILREVLFPKCPPGQTVTAKAVSNRLKAHVGEPVPKGGKTLILKSSADPHSKVLGYYVVVK